ncbi:hypothetical protein KR018_005298 [Drosophila ironensis]|nr:hypothetical protein KR018_005298 [Drosophila ironensis]
MFRFTGYIIVVAALFQNMRVSHAEVYNKHLTLYADPGRQECYYQPIVEKEEIVINYEVIHGGHGEAHINFNLMDPNRNLLIVDEKKANAKHSMTSNATGSFKFCFDNTISTFNQKIISFTLNVSPADKEERELKDLRKAMTTEYQYDTAIQKILVFIHNIRANLIKAEQAQDLIRTHEARDRNLAESNYAMVNNWSWVQFIAMVVVGFLQVFMLRSIFDNHGTLYNFWKNF